MGACVSSAPAEVPQRVPRTIVRHAAAEESFDAPLAAGCPADMVSRAQFIRNTRGPINDAYDQADDTLGEGAFGCVCRASHRNTGVVRAVKKMDVRDIADFREEAAHLKAMDHPNIIRLFQTFEDRTHVYLVLELCDGGDLYERVVAAGHLGERDAASVLQGVFRAVRYVHGRDIVHRDIKPENFMLTHKGALADNVVKLIDFGTARVCTPTGLLSGEVGTSYYMAPQVLWGTYGRECDLWSAGVLLFVALSGTVPFPGTTDNEVFLRVRSGQFAFAARVWSSVSAEAKHLVRKLICVSPRTRLTARQALAHGWLSQLPQPGPARFGEESVRLMGHYGAQSGFKKSALQVIAGQVEHARLRAVKEQFTSLDADHDGALTAEELRSGMKQAGVERSQSSVRRLISGVDANQNGAIDYTEFLAAALAHEAHLDKDLCLLAFDVFDLDGDGLVSEAELAAALRAGEARTEKRGIRELMQEVDLDGDGRISFEEFVRMMHQGDGLDAAAAA